MERLNGSRVNGKNVEIGNLFEQFCTALYEVERIISHRTAPGGKTLYLVKWKGYDDSENSEILPEHFDSKNLMTRYSIIVH